MNKNAVINYYNISDSYLLTSFGIPSGESETDSLYLPASFSFVFGTVNSITQKVKDKWAAFTEQPPVKKVREGWLGKTVESWTVRSTCFHAINSLVVGTVFPGAKFVDLIVLNVIVDLGVTLSVRQHYENKRSSFTTSIGNSSIYFTADSLLKSMGVPFALRKGVSYFASQRVHAYYVYKLTGALLFSQQQSSMNPKELLMEEIIPRDTYRFSQEIVQDVELLSSPFKQRLAATCLDQLLLKEGEAINCCVRAFPAYCQMIREDGELRGLLNAFLNKEVGSKERLEESLREKIKQQYPGELVHILDHHLHSFRDKIKTLLHDKVFRTFIAKEEEWLSTSIVGKKLEIDILDALIFPYLLFAAARIGDFSAQSAPLQKRDSYAFYAASLEVIKGSAFGGGLDEWVIHTIACQGRKLFERELNNLLPAQGEHIFLTERKIQQMAAVFAEIPLGEMSPTKLLETFVIKGQSNQLCGKLIEPLQSSDRSKKAVRTLLDNLFFKEGQVFNLFIRAFEEYTTFLDDAQIQVLILEGNREELHQGFLRKIKQNYPAATVNFIEKIVNLMRGKITTYIPVFLQMMKQKEQEVIQRVLLTNRIENHYKILELFIPSFFVLLGVQFFEFPSRVQELSEREIGRFYQLGLDALEGFFLEEKVDDKAVRLGIDLGKKVRAQLFAQARPAHAFVDPEALFLTPEKIEKIVEIFSGIEVQEMNPAGLVLTSVIKNQSYQYCLQIAESFFSSQRFLYMAADVLNEFFLREGQIFNLAIRSFEEYSKIITGLEVRDFIQNQRKRPEVSWQTKVTNLHQVILQEIKQKYSPATVALVEKMIEFAGGQQICNSINTTLIQAIRQKEEALLGKPLFSALLDLGEETQKDIFKGFLLPYLVLMGVQLFDFSSKTRELTEKEISHFYQLGLETLGMLFSEDLLDNKSMQLGVNLGKRVAEQVFARAKEDSLSPVRSWKEFFAFYTVVAFAHVFNFLTRAVQFFRALPEIFYPK